MCAHPATIRLEVGCRIGAPTGVVVLFEVRLERRGAVDILGFISQGRASTKCHIVVIGRNIVLTLLHAPEDESDAAQEKDTTNTTDNATDNVLVGLAQAAAAVTRVLL